jgi:hypothetical protein
MAGEFQVTSRTSVYSLGLISPNSVVIPALSLRVSAIDEDIKDRVMSGANAGWYIRMQPGNLQEVLTHAGPLGLLPPLWYDTEAAGALRDYVSLFRADSDTQALLRELLNSDEVVVPAFGSAPSQLITLRDIVASHGTTAAILTSPGALAVATDNTGLPSLVLFYTGGIVLVKVVVPALEAFGEGLSTLIRRAFKLPESQ